MPSRLSLLLVAALLGVACGTTPPDGPPTTPEVCDNRADDDGDGKIDCLDPQCFQDAKCQKAGELCDNGADDNGDQATDCADPLCEGRPCGADCICLGGVRVTGSGAGGGGGAATGGGSGGGGGAATGGGTGGGRTGGGGGAATGGGSGGGGAATGGGGAASGGGTGGGGAATGGGSGGGGATTGGGSGGGGAATGGGSGGGGAATGGGSGGGGAASGGGSGGGGAATGGGSGGGGSASELNCADNLDNDGDNATDCDDSNCVGVTCGMGCTCALNRKTEVACGDGADNDGDTLRDCSDSDCFGAGTEICNDGVDNDCDRAIDCGDSSCTGTAQCASLNDGKPCLLDSQCAGGKCYTEAVNGVPNGSCSNATSCTVGTNAGCNGGICIAGSTTNTCFARCTGQGLTGTGACRAGFICFDPDSNTTNGNNYCVTGCASDSECSGSGTGYGCNPWSKRCGSLNRSLKRYGDDCTAGTQCESGICFTGADYPGGYCTGICRADRSNCGPNGYCSHNPAWGDNLGFCYQTCTSTSQCSNFYMSCFPVSSGSTQRYCGCLVSGSACGWDEDCCSGSCDFFTSTCD